MRVPLIIFTAGALDQSTDVWHVRSGFGYDNRRLGQYFPSLGRDMVECKQKCRGRQCLRVGHRRGGRGATISATAGGVTGQILVIVAPGPPASVVIYSGEGQVGNKGTVLADPLCVLVKDARGYLMPGVVATYVVTTGGGTLSSPTAPRTDASGIATSGLWSLGALVGQQTIVASVSGAGSVTFHATAQ